MKTTKAMRERLRELSNPERDDYDRAVVALLDDFEDQARKFRESAALSAFCAMLTNGFMPDQFEGEGEWDYADAAWRAADALIAARPEITP